MRLRTKVTLVIVVAWLLMVAAIYFGAQNILLNSYLKLENNQVINKMLRVQNTIEHLVSEVETFDTDTAVWNDTYDFINSKDPDVINSYIQANLQVTVFAASDIDITFYYNTSGKLVFARAVNATRTNEVPIDNEFFNLLTPKSKLVYQPDKESKISGLISIPSGIYLIAAHAILKTDYSGPPRGTLIMGRYFSDATLHRVGEETNLALTIYRVESDMHDSIIKNVYEKLVKQNSPVVEVKSNDMIDGYILLKDIDDHSIAIIKAEIPRKVYLVGSAAIAKFNAIFLGFGVIFILLLSYLIRALVINRLEKLNQKIINIEKHQKFSIRVNEEGADELTSLEHETNKTLAIIEKYNRKQKVLLNQVSSELDHANDFAKKLKEAEEQLSDIINTMPSMLIIINNDYKITHMNLLAERWVGKTMRETKAKFITDEFVFLKGHENKFRLSLEDDSSQSIDKLIYSSAEETKYFNVVIYPLSKNDPEHALAVRIDDISENVKLKESIQKNDRFASIGVLTAGIAHEINNPINFVKSTVSSVKRNLADIVTIIKKYSQIDEHGADSARLKEMDALKKEIDLEYTIEETKRLLKGISEGTIRTAAIIEGLREFSRVGEETMEKFNVNEGIESTLILIHDKYKNRITIEKEYGDLPDIDSLPVKLNQVFMNLLANSIDAIPNKGVIKIKTKKKDNSVIISIKDNGMGMSEDVKAKIFEPFYTTKEVGKGQGLGLSITFGIISDHNGQIEVKSQPGEGSEFIITLPIKNSK